MSAILFSPLALRDVVLPNRIVVAPMTQFSAEDGVAGDWHLMHLGQFAASGAALILTESCYVAADARNAPSCLSLYTHAQEAAVARIARFVAAHGQGAFGVQLCHGGRKASAKPPWEDGGGPRPVSDGGYAAVAPSAIPVSPDWPTPHALSIAEIAAIVDRFADSARRAARAGACVIELHGAHGYLIHQFLSPITNARGDGYGGALKNRMRFALETFEAVRAAFPDRLPMGVRLSATDWVPGGWDVSDTVALCQALEDLGCDYAHISSGGLSPDQAIAPGPGYQIDFAATVKAAVSMPVIAVGQISDAMQAETILRTGQADLVALGRPMLFNPRWPWSAAVALGEDTYYPKQYLRAHPQKWGRGGLHIPGNYAASPEKPRRIS